MNLHAALTLLACLGHLAFAILAWLRRAQSRLALLVAALFLDAFVWNFAEFAHMGWLERGLAFWLFGTMTLTMLVFAGWRELGRASALAAERTQRRTALGRCSEQLAHDLRNPLAALKGALQFLHRTRSRTFTRSARAVPRSDGRADGAARAHVAGLSAPGTGGARDFAGQPERVAQRLGTTVWLSFPDRATERRTA